MLQLGRSVRLCRFLKFKKLNGRLFDSKLNLHSLASCDTLFPQCAVFVRPDKLIQRKYSLHSPLEKLEESNAKPKPDIEDSLMFADSILKRGGFLRSKVLQEFIDRLKYSSSITSSQALFMLRCCGSSATLESSEVRNKYASKLWNLYETQGVHLDISHYNALLQVFLENEHKFSPLDFLATLQEKNIEPNRITYGRLIAKFCQEGDIEGSNKILSFMKEKELPVGEYIFNFLIMGYSRANDLEGAKSILDVMKQNDITPGPDTYSSLLQAYAEHQDLESIREFLAKTETEVSLFARSYMDLIFALAEKNLTQPIEEILSKINKKEGYTALVSQTTSRLIPRGHDEVAFQLYKSLSFGENQNYVGAFFPKQLAAADIDLYKVVNYCDELRKNEWNVNAFELALESYLYEENEEKALGLLRVMKEKGVPLKEHYFYPLLCIARKKNDREKVFEVFEEMIRMEVEFERDLVGNFLLPSLGISEDLSDIEDVFMRIMASRGGFNASFVYGGVVEYLIRKHGLDMAAQFVNKFPRGIPKSFRALLADIFHHTNNVPSTVSLLRQMLPLTVRLQRNPDEDPNLDQAYDGVKGFLLMVVNNLKSSNAIESRLTPFLMEMKAQGVRISPAIVDAVTENIGGSMTPEIGELLTALTDLSLVPSSGERGESQQRFSSVESLEHRLKEAESNGKDTHELNIQLLRKLLWLRKTKEAEEHYNQLISEGVSIPPNVMISLMDCFIEDKNLPDAEAAFNKLTEENPGFKITSHKIVKFASLLIYNDRFQDAVKFILMNSPSDGEWPEELKPNFEDVIHRNRISNMLMAMVEKKDIESLKLMQEALLNRKLMSPRFVLAPLIKYYLNEDNIEEAMTAFENIADEHNTTAAKENLTIACIEKEDTEKIQKIIDISSKYHGDMNTLYDLVFAFIEVGKLKQAERVLQTSGLRTYQNRLNDRCEFYLRNDKITQLEGLVSVTKGLFNLDRHKLYEYLLEGMIAKDDAEKALGVWTLMQEENVYPSDSFLVKLGCYLQSKGLEVPFSVPTNVAVSSPKETQAQPVRLRTSNQKFQPPRDSQTEFVGALNSQNLRDAEVIWKRFKDSGEAIAPNLSSQYLFLLLRNGRVEDALAEAKSLLARNETPSANVLKHLTDKLADNADIVNLEFIGKYLNEDMKRKVFFSSKMGQAYINSDRAEEYLNKTIDLLNEKNEIDEDIYYRISPTVIKSVLFDRPQYTPLLEKCAELAEKKGHTTMYKTIWDIKFSQGKTEEANELYEKYLQNETNLTVRRTCSKGFLSKDINLIKDLLAVIDKKQEGREALKGFALSTYIDILSRENQFEEAVKVIDNSLKSINLSNYRLGSLISLRKEMMKQNLTFPYNIDNLQKSRESSSSSSSSDDEKKK